MVCKQDLGQFICKKFSTWSKKTKKFCKHNNNQYHKLALVRMEALKASMTRPVISLENRLKTITDSEIANNRLIIKCMADAVLWCGQQCVDLRGHRDDSTVDSEICNKGNFLALLDYSVRSGNMALAKHLREASKMPFTLVRQLKINLYW